MMSIPLGPLRQTQPRIGDRVVLNADIYTQACIFTVVDFREGFITASWNSPERGVVEKEYPVAALTLIERA